MLTLEGAKKWDRLRQLKDPASETARRVLRSSLAVCALALAVMLITSAGAHAGNASHVKLRVAVAGDACVLTVTTSGAPRGSGVVLQRRRGLADWRSYRSLQVEPGRSTKRTACSPYPWTSVRAVLVRDRRTLARSSSVLLPPDTTPPDTTIATEPSDRTGEPAASFTYAATPAEPGVAFACRIDRQPFAACPVTGWTAGALPDGDHTFQVRAIDAAGNADRTAATRTWTVDTTPPETTIESGPTGPVKETSARFTYGGVVPADTERFECRVDAQPFGDCAESGRTAEALPDGTHTFEVRAIDDVGNTDPTPARRTWRVDTTAPDTSIDSGPTGRVAATTATFEYAGGAADDTARFECSTDDSDWTTCAADGANVDNLRHGAHDFRVRAVDALGNADPTPASRTWVVDVTAPDTKLMDVPPASTTQRSFTLTYSGVPAADSDRYECRLDDARFTPCSPSGSTTPALDDGEHRFEVRALDALGNVDASPVAHSWRVDTRAPDTSITERPEGETKARTARFTYAGTDDDVDHFECALDSSTYAPCAESGVRFRALADGEHRFSVRAVDDIGNTDETVASRTWTVSGPADPGAVAPSSQIAELFPTTLRDSLPANGVDPRVGGLTNDGFAIQDAGVGTIGSTLSKGVTLREGEVSLGITPAGTSQAVGVSGDDAVLYRDSDGKDAAVRPTGDKGVEILARLPEDTTTAEYELDIPAGSRLTKLSNGDIAVVDPAQSPHPELAEIGQRVEQAKDEVVAAAVESAADSHEEGEAHEKLAEGYRAVSEVPGIDAPLAPDPATIKDDAGEIPAYADPDATLSQLKEAVEELEQAADPADLTPEHVAAIKRAEDAYEDAKALEDKLPELEALAIEAEASKRFDQEAAAILSEQIEADRADAADADLDIGDAAAEQERTAVKAIAAQSEVDDGRVIGLVSAPMAKADSGDPVATSLHIVGDSAISLKVPPGIEGDVVVDPIFVPIVLFAVRHAATKVAPRVIQAATQGAKQVLSKGGSAAGQVGSKVAPKIVKIQKAVRGAASQATQAAQRVVLYTRAAGSLAARAGQGGPAAARLQAQARAAQQAAAQRVRDLQAAGRKALDELLDHGRRARQEVLRKRDEIFKKAEALARDSVKAVHDAALTAGRQARETLVAVGQKIAQNVRSRLDRTLLQGEHEAVGVYIKSELSERIERALDKFAGDTPAADCYAPLVERLIERRPSTAAGTLVNSTARGADVMDCLSELFYESETPDVSAPGHPGQSVWPTRAELQQIFDSSLEDARREGRATLADFAPPPSSAPERKAAVVGTTIPPHVDAGRLGFFQVSAVNQGRPLSLSETFISVPGGFPWIQAGNVPGLTDRVRLTDENGDGRWDHGEVVSAIIEIKAPLMRSASRSVSYGFVSGSDEFSPGSSMPVNVRGPLEELRVYNMVTNGPTQMREDPVPVRLTTQPWKSCSRRGCNINGTERGTGGVYHHAVCRTTGEETTNGDNSNTPQGWSDDNNPNRYTSNEYYGVQLGGTFGYVSWAWIHPVDRGGLDLPYC